MNPPNELFMREAIELSRRGFPAPNPRVGAVVVKDEAIIGRGHHDAAGEDHAEVVALREAGELARGADLYVTLEPCSHFGKTPPCVDAIAKAGIARTIIAVTDPHPSAAGGAKRLRALGVETVGGVLGSEAAAINEPFLFCHRHGRPWVKVKAAMTLDGRIATRTGESRWISDEVCRVRAHILRAEAGCVLIGAGTVSADDPSLLVRHVEVRNQPLRVVLDPEAWLRGNEKVLADGAARTMWVSISQITAPLGDHVTAWQCPVAHGSQFDLNQLLQELRRTGICSVLVEGGGRTIEAFFMAGLVNEIELHVAPMVFGSGRSWVDGQGVSEISKAWRLHSVSTEPLGSCLKITGKVNV